jgi:hypothetical protein
VQQARYLWQVPYEKGSELAAPCINSPVTLDMLFNNNNNNNNNGNNKFIQPQGVIVWEPL